MCFVLCLYDFLLLGFGIGVALGLAPKLAFHQKQQHIPLWLKIVFLGCPCVCGCGLCVFGYIQGCEQCMVVGLVVSDGWAPRRLRYTFVLEFPFGRWFGVW